MRKSVLTLITCVVVLLALIVALVLSLVASPSLLFAKVRSSGSYLEFIKYSFVKSLEVFSGLLFLTYESLTTPEQGFAKKWNSKRSNSLRYINSDLGDILNSNAIVSDAPNELKFGSPDEELDSNLKDCEDFETERPILTSYGWFLFRIMTVFRR